MPRIKRKPPVPRLVCADAGGELYDHPDLLMLTRVGDELATPRPPDLMPLPKGSDVFLLPGRRAVGLDPETGEAEVLDENAVAAFVCPGHTLAAHAAFVRDDELGTGDTPVLPLFAYGAVGFAEGRFWVAAHRVDTDQRQVFDSIDPARIDAGAHKLMRAQPDNRLVRHLATCALTYCCPAAKNLALGRFEAPLPTSRACNARCIGCISLQDEDSGYPATQNRITFTPTPDEVVGVMRAHARRAKKPILSFGQGCEGEPLTEAELIAASVAAYRADTTNNSGHGTVNVNTNGSRPEVIADLARAGVNSIRISLNSARPDPYERYYRPAGYTFGHVRQTIAEAKKHNVFVSLNLLYFPGITDTEDELAALQDLLPLGVNFIQLRNLNIDPDRYTTLLHDLPPSPHMGLANFRKRLKKSTDTLQFGYFNPYLG